MIDIDKLKVQVLAGKEKPEALSDEQYFEAYKEYSGYIKEETNKIEQVIADYTSQKKDLVVLDVGCGIFRFNFANVASYIGYERNPSMLAEAKQVLRKNFHKNAWKFHFRAETFSGQSNLTQDCDLILFSHTLYGEMGEFTTSITKALAALSIGGVVLIFHRSCSVHKITSALGEHRMVYEAIDINFQIELPERDKFSSFMNVLFGFDVSALPQNSVDELFEKFNADPALPTSCVVLRHPIWQELQKKLPKGTLSLPGSQNYKNFLSKLKNADARQNYPLGIVEPDTVEQVRACVAWCYKNRIKISVVGGGHSEHCTNTSALVISMKKFADIKVDEEEKVLTFGTGCTSGMITSKAEEHGLVAPLGARPSVGCGMILQGGIGHFSRTFGLSVDNIVGATVVLIDENATLVQVDSNTKSDNSLKWMLQGAGSNVGVVLSISIRGHPVTGVSVSQFKVIPENSIDLLNSYAEHSPKLPNTTSMDAFMYTRDKKRIFSFCAYSVELPGAEIPNAESLFSAFSGISGETELTSPKEYSPMDVYGLELYMTFPKGASFKRCAFIPVSAIPKIAPILEDHLKKSPSEWSYYHFVHCGGVAAEEKEIAFSCRGWEWAIVITGLWQDESPAKVKTWVYDGIFAIQKYCTGIYSVDLGPKELEDVVLARYAFGNNFDRVCSLKKLFDPQNLLVCGCPILQAQQMCEEEKAISHYSPALSLPDRPQLIVAICGKRFVGKDYIAEAMQRLFLAKGWKTRIAAISDEIKFQVAKVYGLDRDKLVNDRVYKEAHRDQLTQFYHEQTKDDPDYNIKQLLGVVSRNANSSKILIIVGMREENVLQNLLQAQCPFLSIFVDASTETRQKYGWEKSLVDSDFTENSIHRDMPWSFVFENNGIGPRHCESWMSECILPKIENMLHSKETQSPADQFRSLLVGTPTFPKPGVIFRDILAALKFPGAPELVKQFIESEISSFNSPILVAIESGGLAMALFPGVRYIRKNGKIAPPFFSTEYKGSHVSRERVGGNHALCLKIGDILPGQQVILLDDVLATGDTLLACADLVHQANATLVKAICIAEFSAHGGKRRLAKYGIECASLVSFPGF